MAKLRSPSSRISTTGSGWRHSQIAAIIKAMTATQRKITMKLLSNQSSVWPRSSTTSRHANPRAARGFDLTGELRRVRDQTLGEDKRHYSDGNVDKENPSPAPAIGDPTAQ